MSILNWFFGIQEPPPRRKINLYHVLELGILITSLYLLKINFATLKIFIPWDVRTIQLSYPDAQL